MATTGGYQDYLRSSKVGPNWAHGPWFQKLWKTVGAMLDAQNDLLRNAQLARTPDGAVTLGMSDALDRKGDDLMLPRGGTAPDPDSVDETDAAYAARLKKPWTTWGQDPTDGGGAGSIKGILTQLQIAGFPIEPTPPNLITTGAFFANHIGDMWQLINGDVTMSTVANGCVNRQDLNGLVIPGNPLVGWTLDARDQFYSHWLLLFVQDVPALTNDADCAAKTRLNQICTRWKSGSAIYSGCAIVPTENSAKCWSWPLTAKWGDASLEWGTNGARFIDPE